jgi:hypothetical protein
VYAFVSVAPGSPWARRAGLAIFAAVTGYGRRVIRVVEVSGREHDARPIWALADAERFGANEVFVLSEPELELRRAMLCDLEQGLSPVCGVDAESGAHAQVWAVAA